MNKEQQELLDGAYQKYCKIANSVEEPDYEIHVDDPHQNCTRLMTTDEFINKCKTDTEFSQRWGLKIVSRKLTNPERYKLWFSNNYQTGMEYNESSMPGFSDSYYEPTPSQLITVTYNDKTIESYE